MSDPAGTRRLDLSFLQQEEASQILDVLERDEQLRRADRERLSKLKSSKRDVKWLHAVSGEWFEEIQKKKFKDDTDVRNLVKPPLTHHLKKKTPKGESEPSRMTTSRNSQSPKSSSSGSSFLKIRSPFSSLFSFKKSSKPNIKLPPQPERPDIFSVSNQIPPSTEVRRKFEIYQPARSVKQIASFFEFQNRAREHEKLEKEVFQVLGDLDRKLAQEQSQTQTFRIPGYKHGGHFSNEGSRHHALEHRKDYSMLSPTDGSKTVSLGEGHTTHATYQPRKFYEMYSNRRRSVSKQESTSKTVYGRSPSLGSPVSTKSPSFPSSSGTFSSSSLQLSSMGPEMEKTRQHKSKRIPVDSIKWNKPRSFEKPEERERSLGSQSTLDLTDNGRPTNNRIFDLYKYKGIFAPTTKDLHGNNIATTANYSNTDNRSDYYRTDPYGLKPAVNFSKRNTRHWEQENKENAFKSNNITSELPSTYPTIDSDKEVEPMEFENESPVQSNSNIIAHHLQSSAETFGVADNTLYPSDLGKRHLQTGDTSTKGDYNLANDNGPNMSHENRLGDSLMTSETGNHKQLETLEGTQGEPPELETMDVDVPSVSSQYTKSTVWTEQHNPYSGLLLTKRDLSSDASGNLQSSFKPRTPSDFTSSKTNGLKNPISHKTSPFFNYTTDRAERLAKLNKEWGFKDNHQGGFMSNMMRYQKRNASSLPDLLDQESCKFINNNETLVAEKNEIPLENNSKSGHLYFQNTTGQTKESRLRHVEYFQKPYTFSNVVNIDSPSEIKEHTSTLSDRVSHQKHYIEKKEPLNLSNDIPTFADVRSRYEAMYCNSGSSKMDAEIGADKNNNRQSTEVIQMPKDFFQGEESKTKSTLFDQKRDSHKTHQIKDSECEMFSKPALPYQTNVVSLTNLQNSNGNLQSELNLESDIYSNPNLIYNLDQPGNKPQEYTEPFTIKDSSVYTTNHIVEESLQRNSSSKAVCQPSQENKSTNLLKQNLLLAPEPYRRDTNINEYTMPSCVGPTSFEDCQTQSTCEISNIKTDLSLENKPTNDNVWTKKTYTCQTVTSNKIYETDYTDSSQPDVEKIEYHKIVSVYYSLPRKYSKKISDITQNNLKNIDNTLESSRAPSALLDKLLNKYQEAGEIHESSYQSTGKISPFGSENVHAKELHTGVTSPSKSHLLNFHIIPLQTSLLNKDSGSFSGEDTTSFDFVDRFSSLHISENEGSHIAKDLQKQKYLKNKNEYSSEGSSPKFTQNIYCTLPKRKSNLQDLERNILEKDITMARERQNIYSQRENMVSTAPGFQDVFLSPTFGYDNQKYSPSYDYTHFPETDRKDKNINNFLIRDNILSKKASFDEGLLIREDLPSIYTTKSLKDLNKPKLYNTSDISQHMESNSNLQTGYHQNINQKDNVPTKTRPSYCSEFVQKKMKPINAKRFSFSFDHAGQQEHGNPRLTKSFGDTIRKPDAESPSVFYSPNSKHVLPVNKHYHGWSSPTEQKSSSNLYRSKSLKVLNAEKQGNMMYTGKESDGSFSSKSHGENMRSRKPSVYVGSSDYHRRFSAGMIIDENDNWPIPETSHENKPVYTSKSLDYGIFGKEQQETLLKNVKRSLTEGRLWRPNILKNPGFLRDEEQCSSQESCPLSCSPGDDQSQGPNQKGFLNIYKDVVLVNSDTDTTTDDEYYLDENDKESEL